MIRDNEAVYDVMISPLMAQIIAICKQHGIPMFATFQYSPGDGEEQGPGHCTTRIPADGESDLFDALHATLRQHNKVLAFAITTRTVEG